ncbi:MAG: hypothetical protein K6D57_01285 [Paludibacteraceae bacterium]|nr:hypothetical protein [Paludibacteraceae bacterium]
MKRILYLIAVILLSVLPSCQSYKPASGNPYYRPLEKFKGDTVAYFNYNFKEHKDFYIGKNFSVLYHDVEHNAKVLPSIKHLKDNYKIQVVIGADLYTEPWIFRQQRRERGHDTTMTEHYCHYVLFAYFDEKHYLNEQDFELCRQEIRDSAKSTEEQRRRMHSCLSDCIIKDIEFFRIDMRFWRHEEIISAKRLASDKQWIRTKSSRYDNMKGIQRLRFSQDTVYCSVRKNGAWQETAAPYYVGEDKKFKEEKMGNKISGGYITIKTDSEEPEVFSFFEFTDNRLRLCSRKTGQLMDFYAEGTKRKKKR